MKFIIFLVVLFCFAVSVTLRLIVLHPVNAFKYFIADLIAYIRYRQWRTCGTADLVCYTGLFGKGKTLSAVHAIVSKYNRYNDKKVFCSRRKKWVTQKVLVISNVHLTSIPYEFMESLSQIVTFCEIQQSKDDDEDTLTLCWVLIDEASTQLNSRSFKNNIDFDLLNKLLTCRHYHICGIYTTSQRFNLEDKLLRDVTQKVIDCDKHWRFQLYSVYDAWELENAGSPTLVKSIHRGGFFVTNKEYGNYDTHSSVDNLKKSCAEGDRLSEQDILALRYAPDNTSMDNIINPSRRYKKMLKKRKG